jgi:predicted TIM-barrel fold metal-dependent hydrolase
MMRSQTGKIVCAVAAALCLAVFPAKTAAAQDTTRPIGDAVKDLPLFDAHVHYKQDAWSFYDTKSIIELMDKSGVAMALVSSTPDEGTIRLWEFAPNRIVPELRPYHDNVTSSNWTKAPGIAEYLKVRLEKYPHQGIGEFHIHSLDTNDAPLMREVIAMAKARDILIHVHSGAEPVRWLYSPDPDVKMIWAHAGLGENAETVHALMAEYPKLFADTSLREDEILGSGADLDPAWRKVVYDFQDRLMIGSDTWVTGQWDRYGDIMTSNRAWLAKLPRDVAEKIAYKNAEKLFGRKVSMELIGKR